MWCAYKHGKELYWIQRCKVTGNQITETDKIDRTPHIFRLCRHKNEGCKTAFLGAKIMHSLQWKGYKLLYVFWEGTRICRSWTSQVVVEMKNIWKKSLVSVFNQTRSTLIVFTNTAVRPMMDISQRQLEKINHKNALTLVLIQSVLAQYES